MFLASKLPQNRISASLVHFLFSVGIFALFVGILLFFWFPNPYFSASGGWQGLRIVAAVDLVLGPLVTLIIFNVKKSRRELTTDIGLIVVIQMLALVWGIKAVYEQRPVAIVFLDSGFYTVPAASLKRQDIDLSELDPFGSTKPVFVFVQRPYEGADLARFAQEVEQDGTPPHEQVWLYQDMQANFDRIKNSSLDIEGIMVANADMRSDIEKLLEKTGTELHSNYYISLTSRYRNVVFVFSADGELIGSVNAPYKKGEV